MGSAFGMANRGPFDSGEDSLMVVLGVTRIDISYTLEGPIVGWYGSSNRHCHGIGFI
jgi:hypothetical protein